MIKNFYFLFIVFLCTHIQSKEIHAGQLNGVEVYVAIESHEKTLASSSTYAYTFEDAIRNIATQNNIDIIFSKDADMTRVYAVNGTKNNQFGKSDGWYGYIVRREQISRPENFLGAILEKGDNVILYYGDVEQTKIVSQLSFQENEGKAVMQVTSSYTQWTPKDGKWISEEIVENLKDVKIHLTMPGNSRQILKTDQQGKVTTKLSKLGLYTYYAEGYSHNTYPHIVKTNERQYFYGVANPLAVTRGEAVAYVMNLFGVDKGERIVNLSDVNRFTPYYDEIETAYSAGIINGYEDGSFKADDTINLLQLVIVLSGLYQFESEDLYQYNLDDVPQWAHTGVNKVIATGLLEGINRNWNQPVTVNMLKQIYNNRE